jgi:hypothetical protein
LALLLNTGNPLSISLSKRFLKFYFQTGTLLSRPTGLQSKPPRVTSSASSEGITLLPNGTYGAYVNGAAGSKIGPVLVRDWHNGTLTANANMTAGTRDNESDSNSTGNMTDPSSNSTQNIDATEDVTGNPYRSQSWNAGYEQAFTGQALNLRTNHTLDFFYGYMNGSEFLHFDKAYAVQGQILSLLPLRDIQTYFYGLVYYINASDTQSIPKMLEAYANPHSMT